MDQARQSADDGGRSAPQPPPPEPGGVGARLTAREQAMADLLLDRCDEPILQRVARLRQDPRVPRGVLLVTGREVDVSAAGRAVAGRIPRAIAVPVAHAAPPHAAVLVPAPAPSVWAHARRWARDEAERRRALVVVSEPVAGLRALRVAYQHAVVDAALALASGAAGPLIESADVVHARMLSRLDAAEQALVVRPIAAILALPAAHRDALLETLDTLRRTGTTAATATALHLHPNSVRYRVDRIQVLTGRRLDDPADRLAIDIAVLLVQLRGDLPPALGLDDAPGDRADLGGWWSAAARRVAGTEIPESWLHPAFLSRRTAVAALPG